MNLVILFEKLSLSEIKGSQDRLCANLRRAAINSNLEKNDGNIDIKLFEGELLNPLEREKIVIFILSDKMRTNMGEYVYKFKKAAIKAFNRAGINLDQDSLAVRTNPSDEVQNFIKRVKKIENQSTDNKSENDEFDYEQKSKQYIPVEPLYTFERVILPKDVLEKIEEAVGILECENKVFNEWGYMRYNRTRQHP
jgi:ribosomal protein L4